VIAGSFGFKQQSSPFSISNQPNSFEICPPNAPLTHAILSHASLNLLNLKRRVFNNFTAFMRLYAAGWHAPSLAWRGFKSLFLIRYLFLLVLAATSKIPS
jgi:hypothetical protein